MSTSVANTLWSRAFVDELVRSGLREVVVAPGSRSTPLVMAIARAEGIRARVHLDERSAGFFALGVGKATGRPAAVITTSGTAVANLFPAVIEASEGGVPLLVLTADRPQRLRGADANQAIDQVDIFGRYPRAFFEMAPPSVDGPALRHLRTVAARAWAQTLGADAGPVHVNFPFDKPLEPEDPADRFEAEHPLAASGRGDGSPFTVTTSARARLGDDELDELVARLDASRGVVVAGPLEPERAAGREAVRFAAAAGLPLLADPLSGARYGSPEGAHVVAAYDLFLRDPAIREALAPTLIVRVGRSPTSAALGDWILHHNGVEHVVIDGGGRWKDHTATATRYVVADPADTLRRLTARWGETSEAAPERAELAWADLWHRAEGAALTAMESDGGRDAKAGATLHEGHVVAATLAALPGDSTLFVSSSMPIRDLDAFGHPRDTSVVVFGNRGASGVDGIVSSAFGVASQRDGPTVCVVGDVAFFHDRNGLLWSREDDASVIFVVIDNDGGGIFHKLPIADHEPEFTRFFATPHGIDPKHVVAAHGIPCVEVEASAVGPALAKALDVGQTAVLHVRTDRAENLRRHRAVEAAVTRSVREALAGRS